MQSKLGKSEVGQNVESSQSKDSVLSMFLNTSNIMCDHIRIGDEISALPHQLQKQASTFGFCLRIRNRKHIRVSVHVFEYI